MTDVLAYSAGAREAAADENALLAKLDAARQHLAAPFAPERVDLVASVAEALLGPRRAAASGPAAHFAFWTRRAALLKLARSFAARVPENTLARPRGLVFHLPPQNVETVFLYSWALAYLAGNANIVRLPHEISARMRAIVDLFLDRLAAAGDQIAILRPLSLAGRSGGEDLRPQRRARGLGRRRQGRAVRPPALAQRRKVDLVRRPVFVLDHQRRGSRQAGRQRPSRARQEAPQRRVRLRPDGLLVAACALCRRRSRDPFGGRAAPARRVRARMDDGRSRGPRRPCDRQDDGCVLRGGEPDALRPSTGGTRT